MKIINLILVIFLMTGSMSFAQDDAERECKRMRFLAGEDLKIKNYKSAVKHYILGEEICGGYDAANYNRLIGSLRNAINGITEPTEKMAYIDTVVAAYSRSETAGGYNQKDDLLRAAFILQSSSPDRELANTLFRRGIATQGSATAEGYVSYFYYNTYARFSAAKEEGKAALKQAMISDYFELSTLISKASMSVKTQETITEYFNAVVRNCDDVLPELKGYMENLPSDPEVKKATVMNFIELLDKKNCTDAPEYGQLIDVYVELDPTSLDAQLMKAKFFISKNKTSEAINTLKTARGIATDDAKKQEISYMIASAQFKANSYKAAYTTAISVTGEHKGKALVIAGKSVGSNANNCGASTFERKCNNIYAVELLERAKALGASTGNSISSYKSRYPTSDDLFQNSNPQSVTLTCYGVTVNPSK